MAKVDRPNYAKEAEALRRAQQNVLADIHSDEHRAAWATLQASVKYRALGTLMHREQVLSDLNTAITVKERVIQQLGDAPLLQAINQIGLDMILDLPSDKEREALIESSVTDFDPLLVPLDPVSLRIRGFSSNNGVIPSAVLTLGVGGSTDVVIFEDNPSNLPVFPAIYISVGDGSFHAKKVMYNQIPKDGGRIRLAQVPTSPPNAMLSLTYPIPSDDSLSNFMNSSMYRKALSIFKK